MTRAVRLLFMRRLRKHPARSALAIMAVAAGVALAVSIVVVNRSVTISFRQFNQTLAGPAPLRVVGPSSRGLAETVVPQIAATDGVASAVPMVQAVSFAENGLGGRNRVIVALGVDCRIEALVGRFGCDPAVLRQRTVADPPLISRVLHRTLLPHAEVRTDLGPLRIGDGPVLPELDGINGGRTVVFPLDVAQQLFARPQTVDVVHVLPEPGQPVDALRDRVQERVGPHHGVLLATDPPPGGTAFLGTFLSLFGLLGVFALAVGAVLVYDTVALSMEERRRELAVVAALGGTGRLMATGALLHVAVLGGLGGMLGALGGIALANPICANLSGFTEQFGGIRLAVHAGWVPFLLGAALGILVAVAASALPVRRALRSDVASELSSRDLRAESAPRLAARRGLVATAVALLALVLCWRSQEGGALEPWQPTAATVGLLVALVAFLIATATLAPVVVHAMERALRRRSGPVRLAAANLVRDPGRTGVMVVTIASSVAVAFITASFTASIRAGITEGITSASAGRVHVANGRGLDLNAEAKLPPAVIDRIREVPGVARVDRFASLVAGHDDESLVAVTAGEHPVLNFDVLRGSRDLRAFNEGAVMIGAGLARARGIDAGDVVTLDALHGRVDVPVLGIWRDGNLNGRSVRMSMALLEELWGPQPAGEVNVSPAPGVGVEQLAQRLREAGLGRDARVRTGAELADDVSEGVGQQLASFWVLQRGMLLVSFIAVLSTLLLVGIQRRREFGLLAAVGMRPDELRSMVLAEAALLGVTGAVLGAISGVGMFEGLRQIGPILIGWQNPFRLDLSAPVVYGAIGLLVVVAASAWPARRLARLEVVEALQYE